MGCQKDADTFASMMIYYIFQPICYFHFKIFFICSIFINKAKLKALNPKLWGCSTGNGDVNSTNAVMNIAQPGDTSL